VSEAPLSPRHPTPLSALRADQPGTIPLRDRAASTRSEEQALLQFQNAAFVPSARAGRNVPAPPSAGGEAFSYSSSR